MKNALVAYFAARDGSDPIAALHLLASDVVYHLMPLSGVEIAGTGRASLEQHLRGLPSSTPATHDLQVTCESNELHFAVGHRKAGGQVVGTFLAVAAVNSDGVIGSYIGAFFADTAVPALSNEGKV